MRSSVRGAISPEKGGRIGIVEAYGPKQGMTTADVGVGHVPKTPRSEVLSPLNIQKTIPSVLEKSLPEVQSVKSAKGLTLKDRLTLQK